MSKSYDLISKMLDDYRLEKMEEEAEANEVAQIQSNSGEDKYKEFLTINQYVIWNLYKEELKKIKTIIFEHPEIDANCEDDVDSMKNFQLAAHQEFGKIARKSHKKLRFYHQYRPKTNSWVIPKKLNRFKFHSSLVQK